MARESKKRKASEESGDLTVVYVRIRTDDYLELKRREAQSGAPIAAQIRILVRDGLRKKGTVIV